MRPERSPAARRRPRLRFKAPPAAPSRMSGDDGGSIGAADEARRQALLNAVQHGGKTMPKVVLARLLGSRADLRPRAAELASSVVPPIVEEVNAMDPERQRAALEEAWPGALAAAEAPAAAQAGRAPDPSRGTGLPELEGAERGRVVTRFPPEPNGYPHIGHAKAAIINEEYARMYDGRMLLRMDDTNPESERLEYYAAIKVGLEWLGVKYDSIKNTSDDIEMIAERGQQLVDSGDAYVCTCKRDRVARNRREMSECKCRSRDDQAERWEKMFAKFKPGEAAARLRGDMSSPNTVMRDPVLFRIIGARHPLLGTKHRVWPSYDMAVAVEDSADGVTHAFRTKEYELRNELYADLLGRLGMRAPRVTEFSRLELKGMPVSKRIIRPLIESGKVSWYDDPRLPTLEALKRRGISPDAVRRFVLSLGLTKADTTAPFATLEALNRKAVDASSIRLFMVRRPVELDVSGWEGGPVVALRNHPSDESMGTREVPTGGGAVCIEEDDADGLSPGSVVRLMGLGNVRIGAGSGARLSGSYDGEDMRDGVPRVQWVPREASSEIHILVPREPFPDGERFDENSLEEVRALAEPHYASVEDGSLVQFVRFGYCRKESRTTAVFAHR